MRRAARQDNFHRSVGLFFAAQGWGTLDLSRLGEGAPDWLISKGIFGFLVEVKSEQAIRHGKVDEPLNERQQKFHAVWPGAIYVVDSIEGCWKILDMYKAPQRIEVRS